MRDRDLPEPRGQLQQLLERARGGRLARCRRERGPLAAGVVVTAGGDQQERSCHQEHGQPRQR